MYLQSDQPGRGALRIIGGGERVRDIAAERTAARHWRHRDAALQVKVAEPGRGEQVRLQAVGARTWSPRLGCSTWFLLLLSRHGLRPVDTNGRLWY